MNRATVDEIYLTKETVANINNVETKTYVSTEVKNIDAEGESSEEEDEMNDLGEAIDDDES